MTREDDLKSSDNKSLRFLKLIYLDILVDNNIFEFLVSGS